MKTLRFFTLMLTALSLSAAFAHLLEMPAKLKYDGPLWLHLLQTLYPAYGKVAGVCEIGAVVSSMALAIAVRNRAPAFAWTLLGAMGVAAAHLIFWVWVAPVNAAMLPLSPDTLPLDWADLRYQWEFAHAARAVLQVIAFGSLVVSLLAERPASN